MIDPLERANCSERARDLEYLKDVLRNNCQILMGLIRKIVESTVVMTNAINAFEQKWGKNEPDSRTDKTGRE